MSISRPLAVIGFVLIAATVTASTAVAVTPEVDNVSSASAHSPVSQMTMTGEPTITCETGNGSGVSITTTTSEGQLLMTGCHITILGFTVNCTSEGQLKGQILIQSSVSHLIYLDENHTKVGALATPPASGLFTSFNCGGSTVEVKGNGVIGEVTSPKCGQSAKNATVVARATGSTQEYRQIEETGTLYQLEAATKGGEFKPVGTNWTVTGASATTGTLTCPEQK